MTCGAAEGPRGQSRLRLAAIVVGTALLLGVLEAGQGRFLYAEYSASQFWPEALARALPSWLILAALFPGILTLARHFRLDRGRRASAVAVHGLAGALFMVVHLGASGAVASWRHGGDPSVGAAFNTMFMRFAVVDYALYWGLVAFVQVLLHQGELRERDAAEAELRADLAEARLLALRSELNPHFLGNALNAISALALTGERDTLLRAVDALSELLRLVLEESEHAVTSLERELEILDRYTEIQTLRYGPRLVFQRAIEEGAQRALVPSLVLQPLVENAVLHGVGARRGQGTVLIGARRERDRLRLEVFDSGPGFAPDAPERIARGVGLRNTRRRLEQMYGADFSLEYDSPPPGGARLSLLIPWREVGVLDARLGAEIGL